MAAPTKDIQARQSSPISSTQKNRMVGKSKKAETCVMTYRRNTPVSMSAIATSINTVTKTGGMAAMKRAAGLMSRDRRLRRDPSSRRDRRRRENGLDFEGRITPYRGVRAGGRAGRTRADASFYERGPHARTVPRLLGHRA